MQIKKFDQVLHDQYDPPARKAVSAWVKMKWGMDSKDNPDEIPAIKLKTAKYLNKNINYLSIDVEGAEFEVIKSINFVKNGAFVLKAKSKPIILFLNGSLPKSTF